MKFLILNTDYPDFLHTLYIEHRGLKQMRYDQQMQARNASLFGVADFYSENLTKLGHEAYDIHANNPHMQIAWAGEHDGINPINGVCYRLNFKRPFYPFINPSDRKPLWYYDILARQIKYHRPDVIINHAMDDISNRFMQKMKAFTKLLVGQIAAPLPASSDYGAYDLILTSLPNYVEYFSEKGIPCELNRLAFEPKVLGALHNGPGTIPVSFVGSLSPAHASRIRLLEYLCDNTGIKIWGNGIGNLSKESAIRRSYAGKAWGRDMYQILHDSKITVNHHIGIAKNYANNMRLYEATGSGAMLITDYKDNLQEIFNVGKEVVAYHSPEECAELIGYYLEHEDEREAIARAGQERTLKEHNYYHRMQELVGIVEKYL